MPHRYTVTVAGKARTVEVEDLDGGRQRVVVDGQERVLEARIEAGAVSWLDGTRLRQAFVDGALPKPTVTVRGKAMTVEVAPARSFALSQVVREAPKATGPLTVRAPIPGRVVRVLVKAGEKVAAGKGLAVIEAMKMENEIKAPRDGTVAEVQCAEGAAVETGHPLFVLG
jgi:glutaconyl-CoA/methylmalonyl-CoA decarboxylase subunit gamma